MVYDKIEHLDINYLNECFLVDFENGEIFWKERPLSHFKSCHNQKMTNTKYSGKKVGYISKSEYMMVCIKGKSYQLHRIIYWMYYNNLRLDNGNIGDIDHINGICLDNRISNLRLVDSNLNCRNTKMFKHNNSGYKGVHFKKENNKWCARINVGNKVKKHLGYFDNIEDAIKIRKEYEEKLGYINRN